MYFSNTIQSSEFLIYKNLLENYLSDPKNEAVKNLFEDVIRSTHHLIKHEIPESNVDHKIYNLVIALSDYKNESNWRYFAEVDPNNIQIEHLHTLNNILTSLAKA